jgi:hypothetical protein
MELLLAVQWQMIETFLQYTDYFLNLMEIMMETALAQLTRWVFGIAHFLLLRYHNYTQAIHILILLQVLGYVAELRTEQVAVIWRVVIAVVLVVIAIVPVLVGILLMGDFVLPKMIVLMLLV